MTIKINRKIVDCSVLKDPDQATVNTVDTDETPAAVTNVVHMHEKLERPQMLHGNTYKITTPLSEHALYVTVNDIILDQGGPGEDKANIPTMNEWGMIMFVVLAGLGAVYYIRRQKRAAR